MRHWIKLCLVAFLMLGISSPQSSADVKSKALAESTVGKRIVQRLNQFVGKHIDLKKPAALAMALWMLNSAPAHAEQNHDLNLHTGKDYTVQYSAGEQEELANIDADWELLKPSPQGEKDVTDSVVYLAMKAGTMWRIMHLTYLGPANGEHLFLGPRNLITTIDGEVIIDLSINTLIGKEGVIKEDIAEITELKHIPHPEHSYYDLTVLAIKDINMAGYEPITTAKYPNEGQDLEMYSYLVNEDNIFDFHNYKLGKRTCTAANLNAVKGFGFNDCLITPTFAVLGSPIVNDKDKLVAMYAGQEELDGVPIPNAYSILVPTNLRDLDLEGYAVEPNDDATIVTTWAQIKSPKRK